MEELRRELKNMGYKQTEVKWIDALIQDFVKKGKLVDKLKNAIKNNSSLVSYSNLLKNEVNSVETMAELERALGELEYEKSEYDWLEDCIEAFKSKGLDAINDFETQFGIIDTTKLKRIIQSNASLNVHCKNVFTTITTEEAALELEAILSGMGYNKDDNPWLSGVIKKFTNKGSVDSIDEYSSKFGQNDSKKLRSNIMSNP